MTENSNLSVTCRYQSVILAEVAVTENSILSVTCRSQSVILAEVAVTENSNLSDLRCYLQNFLHKAMVPL